MKRVEKKKKAFTLIELLAVIVILAIIAVIVTPIISKVIDNAKKETFKETAIGVIRAGEAYMGKYILKNHADPEFPIVFVCNGVVCTDEDETLDISGNVPKSGSIILENHKSIKAEYLSDGKYCAAGVKTNLQVADSCADIDVTKPTVSVEAEGLILKITMTDNESGIAAYCVTTENNSSNCTWIDTTDTYKEHEVTNGTWYVFAKDKKNNVSAPGDGVYAELITFAEQILIDNPTIKTNPTLTTTSQAANENGLYSMSVTNGFGGADGTTYFFRGNVTNNYVSFADLTWRIVRINEDGTVRLILNEHIESGQTSFNSQDSSLGNMYYSNSNVETVVEGWYETNIVNSLSTSSRVASGNYFCEAVRAKSSSQTTAGNASVQLATNYIPDLTCESDGNGRGLVNASVGLLTYGEAVSAGGYYNVASSQFYLATRSTWTMSPAGMSSSGKALVWQITDDYKIRGTSSVTNTLLVRPVINLKANVTVTGTGISTDPYVVE